MKRLHGARRDVLCIDFLLRGFNVFSGILKVAVSVEHIRVNIC